MIAINLFKQLVRRKKMLTFLQVTRYLSWRYTYILSTIHMCRFCDTHYRRTFSLTRYIIHTNKELHSKACVDIREPQQHMFLYKKKRHNFQTVWIWYYVLFELEFMVFDTPLENGMDDLGVLCIYDPLLL